MHIQRKKVILFMAILCAVPLAAASDARPKMNWCKGSTCGFSDDKAVAQSYCSTAMSQSPSNTYWKPHPTIAGEGSTVQYCSNSPVAQYYTSCSWERTATTLEEPKVYVRLDVHIECGGSIPALDGRKSDPDDPIGSGKRLTPEKDCPAGTTGPQTSLPVKIHRGEKYYRFVDYQGGGDFPLVFWREYITEVAPLEVSGSNSSVAGTSSHWNVAYTQNIRNYVVSGVRYAIVTRVNGTYDKYQEASTNSAIYNLVEGTGVDKLEAAWSSGVLTNWLLTKQDGTVERYSAAGYLLTITNPQGLSHSLTSEWLFGVYSSGVITQKTITNDQTGEQLIIDFEDGDIVSVTDPAGKVFQYIWDIQETSSGSGVWMDHERLEAVIYPDDNTDPDNNFVQVFEYNNTYQNGFASLITGIFETTFDEYDANNASAWKRYSRVEYDTLGRVTTSELYDGSSGVETSTFVYNWTWAGGINSGTRPKTTVTNDRGLETVYEFELPEGTTIKNTRNWRITGMVGEDDQTAGMGCAATSYNTTYDENDFVETTEDTIGVVTKRTRDSKGRISALAEGLKRSGSSLQMNGNSQLVKNTGFQGDTLKPTQQEFYGRDTSSQGYVTYADAPGNGWVHYKTIDYAYDANNRITSRVVTDESNNTTRTWTYTNTYHEDENEEATAIPSEIVVDGPLSADSTTYNFNTSGQLESVENALSHETTYANYNAFGLPEIITDVDNGVVTALDYDARGRVTSIVADDGGVEAETVLTYYPNGLLETVTQADGSSLEYFYNSAHHMVGVVNNFDDCVQLLPSALDGKWVSQKTYRDATFNTSTNNCTGGTFSTRNERLFDALGRLSKIMRVLDESSAPSGAKQTFGYDANNNLTTSILKGDGANEPGYDDNDLATVHEYDALDRLVRSVGSFNCGGACDLDNYNNYDDTVPASPETEYAYNGQGLISSVTDAKEHATSFAYNGFGELILENSPDRGKTKYEYDAAGNLVKKTKAFEATDSADTQEIFYSWDNLNRLTAVNYPGTDHDISYSYDAAASGENCGESVGRLCRVVRGAVTTGHVTDYTYNTLGRITVEKVRPAGTNGLAFTTGYSYNTAGALTGITLPGGRSVTVSRSTGRIDEVNSSFGSTPIEHLLAESLVYQPFGGVSAYDMPTNEDALGYRQSYNTDGQIGQIQLLVDGDPASVENYQYDAFGNISEIEDRAGYIYDAQQRLIISMGAFGVYAYQYDAVGNRTQMRKQAYAGTGTGITLEDRWIEDYQYDTGSNRLESVERYAGGAIEENEEPYRIRTFEYDGRGNIKTDERMEDSTTTTLELEYGNGDRLNSITVDVE